MNIVSILLRILAILGAIAAAVMFWMIGDTKEQLEGDLNSTRDRLRQTENQLSTVQEERDEREAEATELAEELEETRAEATRLDNQLTQVRRELEDATEAISAREREAETLRSDAAQIRRQLLEERTRVSELEENLDAEDAAAMRASIQALEQQLLETERQLQTVASSDEEVDERDQPEQPTREVIRGQVAEVASDSPFILLNIGSEDGVRSDSSVMIRRGPRYIGRAVIAEVRENSSVAEVQPGASRVQTGDNAVTLN